MGASFASLNSSLEIIPSLSILARRVLLRSSALAGLLNGLHVEGHGSKETIIADSERVSS